ncbi:DUF58 domain-containing protein [Flavobacteriaceae bacterium]|jgi:uncharacterized protein (DUF58 family)|nr:DUF58 domain-containing protein [Flavobacteriaceae bacterium]MDA9025462.1 DUF58 domain-containing protein [bacterium]MDA9342222.1 DUF58 domain-containing protein [Flavobacteriaceae bacterium]MDB9914115.1 DUF58 domain-containing protein [Flavobacteriaceae bacterium]MDB9989793.1 DUF58 domain-containing protein [Flavobacteriaceae bacterium]|tara:strand:- start:39 stop:968 length:930 start_codon:yes stop_codon:yes gene_type:complete
MDIRKEINEITGFNNLELLAHQVVEGFISGLHKSPFHGFSAEFAEHKIYNQGESIKHIDWKLFAKTDKLYTKRYEEETNLRCHLIIDNSSSMHYPLLKDFDINNLNKIGFSVLAAAAIMNLLKRQRDAVGLSIYSDNYDFYSNEKGSERHHQMLLAKLNEALANKREQVETKTYTYLHEIADKIKRRSMVFLFTDMFQSDLEEEKLFEALQHLKYNKHEVILFHTYDKEKEIEFNFNNRPKQFVDVETGVHVNLYADTIRTNYEKAVKDYFKELKIRCGQYRIKYVPVAVNEDFSTILTTYLVEHQKFG